MKVSAAILCVLAILLLAATPPAPPAETPDAPTTDAPSEDNIEQQQTDTASPELQQEDISERILEIEEQLQEIKSQPPAQNSTLLVLVIITLMITLSTAALVTYLIFKNNQTKPAPAEQTIEQTQVNPRMKDYVQKCRLQGYTDEQIRIQLKNHGHTEKFIEEVLR